MYYPPSKICPGEIQTSTMRLRFRPENKGQPKKPIGDTKCLCFLFMMTSIIIKKMFISIFRISIKKL